jgi:hypothetical protein
MSINNFLTKENVNTLWEVISDEQIFKFLPRDIQENISNLFLNNIKGFFETERIKTKSLTDTNKKYVILILNYIKTTYPYKPNKIKILDEPQASELITYEEIQNDRKTHFEKNLQQRQEEFENTMNVKAPPVPEFSEKITEKPIAEMDKIIKEMTAKRNYEVEQFNRKYQTDINQVNNWLKPQDTSVKSEKFETQNKAETETLKGDNSKTNQQNSKYKFLNIEDQTSVHSSPKKTVSWEDMSKESEVEEEEASIFKKLKKINKPNILQDESNIQISFDEDMNENIDTTRISNLENEMKILNSKMDTILELLLKK